MYPVPTSPPIYTPSPKSPGKQYSRTRLGRLFEQLYFLGATGLTFILAYYLLVNVRNWGWWTLPVLLVTWAIGAYLTLPRLHQFFTDIYVPDYFIARTCTSDGLLGDPINLALIGKESQVHEAMTKTGWTKADPITVGSSLGIVKSSLLRRSYPKAPVSSLFVFGRQQDFTYQLEVDGNAAQRHHVRFWHTPAGWLLPGGRRVDWVAAGTYDRSVGLSLFTGQVTHKIDADIDIERDYIIDSVRYANPDTTVDVIVDFSTGYHSRNGGGDTVRTDGNLPILDVRRLPAIPTPPTEEQRGVKARPMSVGVGLALMLCLIPLQWLFVWLSRGTFEIDPSEPSSDVATPVLLGMVSFITVVHFLLTVLTYRRVLWARMALLALSILSSYMQLFSLIDHSLTVSPIFALFEVVLTISAVYALTSRSARAWTDAKHKRT